jgi:hypothetical protein
MDAVWLCGVFGWLLEVGFGSVGWGAVRSRFGGWWFGGWWLARWLVALFLNKKSQRGLQGAKCMCEANMQTQASNAHAGRASQQPSNKRPLPNL